MVADASTPGDMIEGVRGLIVNAAGIVGGCAADRDDIQQDLVLHLLTHVVPAYRPEHGAWPAFAAQSLRNKAVDLLRRRVRHARVQTSRLPDEVPAGTGDGGRAIEHLVNEIMADPTRFFPDMPADLVRAALDRNTPIPSERQRVWGARTRIAKRLRELVADVA